MNIFFQILFLSCTIFSCATPKETSPKSPVISEEGTVNRNGSQELLAKAFFSVTTGGAQIKIDDETETTYTVSRFLILEFADDVNPKINNIFFGTRNYDIIGLVSEGGRIVVGKNFIDDQPVELQSKKGYKLWKIDLSPADGKQDYKTAQNNILVKWETDNKISTIQIHEETELQGENRY